MTNTFVVYAFIENFYKKQQTAYSKAACCFGFMKLIVYISTLKSASAMYMGGADVQVVYRGRSAELTAFSYKDR